MKALTGKVISLKTPQTATVLVEERWQHPVYGKFIKRSKKVACHYTDIVLVDGDVVEIASCRPISKTKRHQVVKKIEG